MAWLKDTKSYWTFAENDYQWFIDTYQTGTYYLGLAELGYSICERYCKYIIDEYYLPKTAEERNAKEYVLQSCDLLKLIRFINGNMGLPVPEEVTQQLLIVNRLLLSSYCSKNCNKIPSKQEIDCIAETVETVRSFVFGLPFFLQQMQEVSYLHTLAGDNAYTPQAREKAK